MAEVSFTNAAEADLTNIDAFSVARFGEEAGETYMRGFDAAFARLARFPLIGRAVPEHGPDIHCLTSGSHRIFYRVDSDRVLILRILHQARDAQVALKT